MKKAIIMMAVAILSFSTAFAQQKLEKISKKTTTELVTVKAENVVGCEKMNAQCQKAEGQKECLKSDAKKEYGRVANAPLRAVKCDKKAECCKKECDKKAECCKKECAEKAECCKKECDKKCEGKCPNCKCQDCQCTPANCCAGKECCKQNCADKAACCKEAKCDKKAECDKKSECCKKEAK